MHHKLSMDQVHSCPNVTVELLRHDLFFMRFLVWESLLGRGTPRHDR